MTGIRKKQAWIVGSLALLIMVVRVDFWWWGEVMPPVLFGTVNLPMLYQGVLWAAGWALTVYAVDALKLEEE
jgi:hypothetical protein